MDEVMFYQIGDERIQADAKMIAYFNKWTKETDAQQKELDNDKKTKAIAKAAVLNKLGITSEEADSLFV